MNEDDRGRRRIAGRYELVARLGEGAHGEVWEARDTVSSRTVAVKLLRPGVEFSAARAQLEAAALRLRLPGVVELFDDGVEDGRPYLVMELVEGSKFPGVEGACTWAQIADVTVALLETLAHVHAASVVHRDLKPQNVLVTDKRRIKLLDFGIAMRTGVTADRLTQDARILGTLEYMAPEQIRGQPESRSDLFTVGVMLYEALAGRCPFTGDNFGAILRAHQQRPVPLAQAAPGVPLLVAQVVDRLLAYKADDRPRSATEVLHTLRGEPSVETPDFPWLGSQAPLRALVAAVQAGRSVDVVGPHGAGRTRCLLALTQAREEQQRVVWLAPSEEAFASLAPLVGPLSEMEEASFDEVRAHVKREVRRALSEGAILVADDAEDIDRASANVLAACRGDGAIVRAIHKEARPADTGLGPRTAADEESIDFRAPEELEVLSLAPLREKDLRRLFAGPDRLLHLREDAARVLRIRTEGMPGRVAEEITRWVRLGIAHWAKGHLVVTREAIEALESGLLLAAPIDTADSTLSAVPEALVDLLAWLTLAWPHTTIELLSKAAALPRFRVEAHLSALVELELVKKAPDGTFVPRRTISAATRWTEDRVRAAHTTLAKLLPPGAAGRLAHLALRGSSTDDDRRAIAAEACALAERLIDEGRLEPAMAMLERGLRPVREMGPIAAPEIECLLSVWVEAAIESAKPPALDRVLFEICRTEPRTELIGRLELLGRAALGTHEFSSRPLDLIGQVPAFEHTRLERARLSVRAQAARHLSDLSLHETILRDIERALPPGDADAEAIVANHWGRLRYRQSRFEEAAALHSEAARKAKNPLVRAYAFISATFASMDAFAFEDARRWASLAAELSRAQRHAYYEALAEWTLRTISYRQGTAGDPDIELVEASSFVGVKYVEGLISFNEAAVAYRRGHHSATSLAKQAHDALISIGEDQSALVMRSLLIRLGADSSPEEVDDLVSRALGPLMPGLGLQALALLAMAGRLSPGRLDTARILDLARAVPRQHWAKRMDILSVDECLSALT